MDTTITKRLKKSERRSDTRLDLSLPVTLFLDKEFVTMSKNICAGGVSFIVYNDKIKLFTPGKTIRIEIAANIVTPRLPKKTVTLAGYGLVIRNNEIDISKFDRNKKKSCVALQFTETLKVTSISL
jgi:hypothetical protein